jgi:hypothetical protein
MNAKRFIVFKGSIDSPTGITYEVSIEDYNILMTLLDKMVYYSKARKVEI